MTRDLVVLVPDIDIDIEVGLRALLARHESLAIRPLLGVEFVRHQHRDPGVYKRPHESLRLVRREFEHALVVLDEAWSGSPGASDIERDVENRCRPDWSERVRCVCIEPEVEAWVWSDSPHSAAALGWSDAMALRAFLAARGQWPTGRAKPPDPKSAVEAALAERRLPASPEVFRRVAAHVSLARCTDPAFARLLQILRAWFPANQSAGTV